MKVITTKDGSHTLLSDKINDTYHSTNGAITEALSVYIKNGYLECVRATTDSIHVLEIGFGTGLNALLTAIEAKKEKRKTIYYALEPYPIDINKVLSLNYGDEDLEKKSFFEKIHQSLWQTPVEINEYFTLIKTKSKLQDVDFKSLFFHVVYFDAFGPEKQPELWSEELFLKIANILISPSIITTYSTKGDVKRALQNIGFKIEKLPGPPGKREVLRAIKKQ